MEHLFTSGGHRIAAHLAQPPARADVSTVPAIVVAHGYPSDVGSAPAAAHSMIELADRISRRLGWVSMPVGSRHLQPATIPGGDSQP